MYLVCGYEFVFWEGASLPHYSQKSIEVALQSHRWVFNQMPETRVSTYSEKMPLVHLVAL